MHRGTHTDVPISDIQAGSETTQVIQGVIRESQGVPSIIFIILTRKSNLFHGFLNGLTQPVYSVFQS